MARPEKAPAARQVLEILGHLARQAGPVPAAAVARDLGLPRSTTYQLLATMVESGFVVHLADERRYCLGAAAYELSSGYSRSEPLVRLARVPMTRLAERTGHVAHLAVLHGNEVLYVIENRPAGAPQLNSDVGVRLPAQLTASGRAMLAALPAAQVGALFMHPDAFAGRSGAVPLPALRDLLTETRRRGYATEDGEVTPGIAAVGVAVLDHAGYPAAGVAVSYPRDAPEAGVVDHAMHAAHVISSRIGGQPSQ
ncbi:IclR family transcriptional regulator [Pseudonocardia humida]|uniref:IclR family transcriptional regulator n=1 Tax=Pseudonocardia humida TaxID=2800819 RepID=A0ABT1A3A2_9PSEU|nr:IclR family transcriptional regulator [Pseudonocardia humida]MCO1657477.1 IclR family transcriptional regulator [Pseudonocardia humida]